MRFLNSWAEWGSLLSINIVLIICVERGCHAGRVPVLFCEIEDPKLSTSRKNAQGLFVINKHRYHRLCWEMLPCRESACGRLLRNSEWVAVCCSVVQCVAAVTFIVAPWVVVSCSDVQCVAVWHESLIGFQSGTLCCCVLQCAAECCRVLQCDMTPKRAKFVCDRPLSQQERCVYMYIYIYIKCVYIIYIYIYIYE